MDANGNNKGQTTHLYYRGLGGVSWSSDGSELVYGTAATTGQCPGPNGALGLGPLEIHVVNADGTNDTVLESEPFIPNIAFNTSRHPDWSPDGAQITFASEKGGDLQIWTMNADGSGQTQVTHDPNTPENFSRFSPEGSQLVFQAANTEADLTVGVDIRVVNVDGTHEMKLTDSKDRNVQPSWGAQPED
jgi:TolB protein